MSKFITKYKARWSDIDANGHVRHSVYNDFCAHARVEIFKAYGQPLSSMQSLNIGPVLFREEMRFFKEVKLDDEVVVETSVKKLRNDCTKWTIEHRLFSDRELAAKLEADGSWIDLKKRKVAPPDQSVIDAMHSFPKSEEFEVIPDKTISN
jgi:acyl-CoA thioester hydrolase